MTDTFQNSLAAQASFSDLFFRLLDPAFLIEAETLKILEVNDAAEKAFGQTAEKLRGTSIQLWIPEDHRAAFEQQVRVTMRRYHPRVHETSFVVEEGKSRIFRCDLCQLTIQSDGESRPVLQLIAHDVTAQREAEKNAEKYLAELQSVNEKLREMSITDEMTGIHNFRYFKQRLDIEHQRSIRFKRSYCILFFDLDNFKHYNDRNGHPAGDALLRQFAQILKKSSRETDCPARYGGEEFIILAPETTQAQGGEFAERLRRVIHSTVFEHAAGQPLGRVSASIGIASFPESGQTPDEVIKSADQAMYVSKKQGRDRATLHRDIASAAP